MKVRQGKVIFQAFRWTSGPDQQEEPEWAIGAMRTGQLSFENLGTQMVRLQIRTPMGLLNAERGDWIIREPDGTMYPCKPAVFNRTYKWIGPRERTSFLSKLWNMIKGRKRAHKKKPRT